MSATEEAILDHDDIKAGDLVVCTEDISDVDSPPPNPKYGYSYKVSAVVEERDGCEELYELEEFPDVPDGHERGFSWWQFMKFYGPGDGK